MRTAFLKPMLDKGFTECVYCGKIIPHTLNSNGACPDCSEKS